MTSAQNIALENQNMQIMPEHLLYALADQDGGLVPQLLKKQGVDCDSLLAAVDREIEKIPAVYGSGREPDKIYVAPLTDKILSHAEKLAAQQKDEYVSVEHLMLSLLDNAPQNVGEIFRAFGITRRSFEQQLAKVKSSPVTGDDPESTYDALSKYGFDLVERAKAQKLGPRNRAGQRDT